MPMLDDKQKLSRKLMQCSFALTEANLYLDSHPTCKMGLEYFQKHKAEYEEILADYTQKYGPVTPRDSKSTTKWDWVTTPFPWERGES